MSTLPGTTLCEAALKLFLPNLETFSCKTIFLLSGGYNKRGHSQLFHDYFGMVEQAIAKHMPIFTGRKDSEWCLSMFLIYCEYFSFLEIGALLC